MFYIVWLLSCLVLIHFSVECSALGNVINALVTGRTHIPYRDSKLTRLLSGQSSNLIARPSNMCISP